MPADFGPALEVGRGSSPGCVSGGEFEAVQVGITRHEVTTGWDTAGHLRSRTGDTVFAKYTRRADGLYYLVWKQAVAP